MVNLTPSATKSKHIEYFDFAVYENVIVDKSDTLTLSEFLLSAGALTQALLVDNSDGSEIATTITMNVVTVTGDATDKDCTLFAYGRRAA